MTNAGGHDATAAHAPSDHGAGADAHGAHDAFDGEEPLGPIDVQAWLAGLIGVAVGLVMAACFVLAAQGTGAF
jgi:hypothetical protein